MKKIILSATIAVLATSALAQSNEAKTGNKEVKSTPLTFESLEAKKHEITRIEELIELRQSQGKTQEELSRYYIELDRVKNSTVANTETK